MQKKDLNFEQTCGFEGGLGHLSFVCALFLELKSHLSVAGRSHRDRRRHRFKSARQDRCRLLI